MTARAILVEKDVDVPMRDGARLKADVFRPDDGGKFPAILNLGPYQKDKLWVPPPAARGEAERPHELGDRHPGMVGAEGLRRGARRRPRQRQVARPVRAVVARRGDRFLRRHRMGGGAAVVQRQGRAVRHFLLRHQPVVRRQSAAAVAEGDHSVGRLRRHLPRRAVPRRHPQRVHDQLVHRASDASRAWAAPRSISRTAGRPTRCGIWLHNNLDSGALRGAQAQWDRITVPLLSVGNWTGFALHLRGNTEAFMRAASKHKKLRIHTGIARASVLHRGGQARSAPLLRLLAQGHRQRRDGRAAGQARDPQGRATRSNGAHEHEWPLKRTQWTKFYFDLSRPPPGEAPRAGSLVAENPAKASSLHLSGVQPRHDGLDLGGLVAGDGRRHQARHGRRAVDAAAGAGHRDHRPARRDASGCRARARTWTCS